MTTSRTKLMKQLKEKFPKMWLKTGEEFNGSEGAIWTGEGSVVEVKDPTGNFCLPIFDYYAEDYQEVTYIGGIYKPLFQFLFGVGWSPEFYDCGTILIYKQ